MGFLVGSVEFSRATPTLADIPIPAGTLIAGRDVPAVQTTKPAVLEAGRRSVLVEVRSVERPSEAKPVAATSLTLMPRPIAGIEQVSNQAPLIVRHAAETDDELRERARQIVRGAHTGTVDALVRAVRGCGIATIKVLEDFVRQPGQVVLVLGDDGLDPATMERVQAAVAAVRPAGVRVLVGAATPVTVRVAAGLQLNKAYPTAERQQLVADLRSALKAYFDTLDVGETVRAGKLRTILGGDPRVVAVTEVPGINLLEPRAGDISLASKVLTNGDYVPDATERAVLAFDSEWPKLLPISPGVRIDAALRLAIGPNVGDVRRQFSTDLAALLAAKADEFARAEQRAAAAGNPPLLELSFAELRHTLAIGDDPIRRLRFTVVHERSGRVTEMTTDAEKETFEPGERPRLGDVSVELAGDG